MRLALLGALPGSAVVETPSLPHLPKLSSLKSLSAIHELAERGSMAVLNVGARLAEKRFSPQLYTDVANNELAFALGTSATTSALHSAGKLRFLAVAAPRRIAAFPEVPTVGEAGGPAGFEVIGWTMLAAPKGLPVAILDKIQRDVEKALAEQDIRERYRAFGYEVFPLSRGQFAQFIRAESVRFGDVIKQAKVAIE